MQDFLFFTPPLWLHGIHVIYRDGGSMWIDGAIDIMALNSCTRSVIIRLIGYKPEGICAYG